MSFNGYAQLLALSGMGSPAGYIGGVPNPQGVWHPDPMGDYDDLSDTDDEWIDDAIILGDDPDEDHIGGPARVANKIDEVDQQIARLQMKSANARNAKQRARLQKRIRRLQVHRAKLVSRAGRQIARRGDKMHPAELQQMQARGLLPAVAAGTAAGGAAGLVGGALLPSGAMVQTPRPPGYYTGDAAWRDDGLAYSNWVERNPPAGEGVRIPLLIGGAPLATFTIAAGVGSRTVAIAAQTSQITYAGFRVYGIETIIQLQPTNEGLISATIDNCTVNGGVNLLYGAQNASFAGQGGTAGSQTGGKATIAGLRQNPILEPNNTATLNATIRQDADNGADINGTVQFALIVRTITDNQSGRD